METTSIYNWFPGYQFFRPIKFWSILLCFLAFDIKFHTNDRLRLAKEHKYLGTSQYQSTISGLLLFIYLYLFMIFRKKIYIYIYIWTYIFGYNLKAIESWRVFKNANSCHQPISHILVMFTTNLINQTKKVYVDPNKSN